MNNFSKDGRVHKHFTLEESVSPPPHDVASHIYPSTIQERGAFLENMKCHSFSLKNHSDADVHFVGE